MTFKKQTFLLIFLVFAVFSMSRIRFLDEYVMPGGELEVHTSVVNSGDRDIDDVRVVAYFPELGETSNGARFDVQDKDNHGKLFWWNVPQTIPPGEYLVRITASNDGHRARKFRYITVE